MIAEKSPVLRSAVERLDRVNRSKRLQRELDALERGRIDFMLMKAGERRGRGWGSKIKGGENFIKKIFGV